VALLKMVYPETRPSRQQQRINWHWLLFFIALTAYVLV